MSWARASARNEAFLRELGVDHVIDYNEARFEDVATDVDVVLDGVGGEVQDRSWSVLKAGRHAGVHPRGDRTPSRPRPAASARSTFPSMPNRRNSGPSPTWWRQGASGCTWTRCFRWTKCARLTS